MADIPNVEVQDITGDVALITSKPKIKANFDDLLENDLNLDSRTDTLENGGFTGASRWNDIIITPTALAGGASAPDLVNFIGGIWLYTFDGGATTEEVYGSFEIPHDYKEGTDLRPHIHWAPINASAGNVKWQIEYSKAIKEAVFPATTTISGTDAAGGALAHHVVETDVISGAGVTIGTVIGFRLFRNPSDVADTYTGDAFLLSVGIHYQVDSTGSTSVMAK